MTADGSGVPSPMQWPSESRHLRAVREIVEDMRRRGRTDVESALRELNESSLRTIPGAQYAGITVLDRAGSVESLGVTSRYPTLLDDAQRDTGEGPCLSAAWDHHTVLIEDLVTDERWPKFRRAALHQAPVRSVLSFQLLVEDGQLAALNFHAERPRVFDRDAIELGLAVAAHTMVAWNFISREKQFRSALASRDIIGQAKGMLMERFNINAVAAFELLKRLSQESNVKLADIATKIVELDHPSH